MKTCRNCNSVLVRLTSKVFCSLSCAATYNNTIHPKRKRKIRECIVCSKATFDVRRKFCPDCILYGWNNNWPIKPLSHRTLKEEIEINPILGTNRYNRIRLSLRHRYRHILDKLKCQNCNYKKHVEVCHIKPISKFNMNELISTINHETNIALLCPNCHWEFDHGKLKL